MTVCMTLLILLGVIGMTPWKLLEALDDLEALEALDDPWKLLHRGAYPDTDEATDCEQCAGSHRVSLRVSLRTR